MKKTLPLSSGGALSSRRSHRNDGASDAMVRCPSTTDSRSTQTLYGEKIANMLATALDLNCDYLYRSRTVAKAFSGDKLEALRERRNVNGRRIGFSHLELISAISGSDDRERLIGEFFEKGLTTRQLIQRVKQLTGKSKTGQRPRPKSPSAGLNTMQKFAQDYRDKTRERNAVVFAPVEEAISNEFDTSHLEALIETKTSHEEFKQQVEANIQKLDDCIRWARQAQEEGPKAKRGPKTTTPSRPVATKRKKKKAKTPTRRKRIVA